ncbi:hypothetical protein IV203_029897 [Nitzschia inconspicua]|uniref:Uncharacterized protein n=1 Tax=Nitzschia inconspicua TaxID=303405 RepID=A0A9K3Q1E4_9STRA|nr:hypothetical protein IV203_029897 [Nitzschia inconspicua]
MFNVFLKMWDGKTLCCVINAHQAAIVHVVVHTLEKKVMEQYPTMNRKNFFFEVGGKPLSTTTNTTTACLLHNGSTVFVQYRNRGGCFMVSFTVMMTIFALILSSTFGVLSQVSQSRALN